MSVHITIPDNEQERENNRRNYEYIAQNLIRPGSIVTPKTYIEFSDGHTHIPDCSYHVTEDTISYYVVNFSSYIVEKY